MGTDPTTVDIDGRRYTIAGRTHSGSRGHEFQLIDPARPGLIARVCWAPPPGQRAGTVRTSGETLTFHY